ncbi:MAG: hypothetical protein A2820_00010 [Candidatus Buchananbacteria bacterium RIFCSPHIGHO2_01_FULL_40_35]|nr:MAG: hypothetical protein A2820_00010 [Candidatus Buchananbacteria bacterium RIFCSPHIGHO2_01_FULL_40_35]
MKKERRCSALSPSLELLRPLTGNGVGSLKDGFPAAAPFWLAPKLPGLPAKLYNSSPLIEPVRENRTL